MAITFRADKGSALTYSELDTNFGNFFVDASISGSDLTLHYATSSNVPVSESAVTINLGNLTTQPSAPEGSIQFNNGGEFGGNERFIFDNQTASVGIGYDLANTQTSPHTLIVSGSIEASGNVIAFSDKTLKDNLEPISKGLEIIDSISGYTYDKDGDRHAGLIAQEVQAVLPEAVKQGTNGYLGLDYNGVVAALVEAVKTLQQRVEELENR